MARLEKRAARGLIAAVVMVVPLRVRAPPARPALFTAAVLVSDGRTRRQPPPPIRSLTRPATAAT